MEGQKVIIGCESHFDSTTSGFRVEEVQLSKERVSRESGQTDASVAEITAMSLLEMRK